jgi:hypothetical protein
MRAINARLVVESETVRAGLRALGEAARRANLEP